MFALLFLGHFIFADWNQEPIPNDAVTTSNETYVAQTSPFFACSGPRNNLTGQVKTGWLSGRVPLEDQTGNQTRDFFIALQKKIQERSEQNLELTQQTIDCLKIPRESTNSPECAENRNWVNPTQFPPPAGSEPKKSLIDIVKEARANLAVAHSNTKWNETTLVNAQLNPYGYKHTAWNPLSPDESGKAKKLLEGYQEAFRQKHNLSQDEFQELLEPYDRMQKDGQVYANPMNVSDGEIRHQILQSEWHRQMYRIRNQYLNAYNAIVSQYPIINYLNSEHPSVTEVVAAAKRVKINGEKELALIKKQGEQLRAKTGSRISNDTLNLLDYKSLVEEVLAENPQFCAVATTADIGRSKRQFNSAVFSTVLQTAPLLAASFFAPPLAFAIGAGIGSWTAMNSYSDFQMEKQAAYSAIINDGSLRAGAADVNAARTTMTKDILFIPVSAVMMGATSKIGRSLQPAKTP